MRSRRRALVTVLLALLGAACGAQPATNRAADGTWFGTITTEGNATTVVNESGSVWGGAATLVEEASIGVDVGDDPYMFGNVAAVWATEDRIYVADYDVPAVRVYDNQGVHIMDIGRRGQGPGEFQAPNSVVVGPDGRIYVKEGRPGGRINVYDPHGSSIDTLYGDRMLASAWPLVVTRDGSLYTPTRAQLDADDPGSDGPAMAIAGPAGVVGEPIAVPMLGYEFGGVRVNERVVLSVPYAPHHTWAMSPSGAFVVGVTGDYRFEIHALDGHVTVVEKRYEPTAIDPAEAEWHRRSTVRSGRRWQEGWTWDGAAIPRFKPAWSGLTVDADGRVWVARRGPSRRLDECDEDPLAIGEDRVRPCWDAALDYEVFDDEGKFLGPVERPEAVDYLSDSFIKGDRLIVAMEDAAGTPMVKRYRLVLPSEQQQ